MNAIQLKNVCKTYGDFKLQDISINIPQGSIVGFIGENGAGKTTTIKAMLNLINIDDGNVCYDNSELSQNEIEIKEKIGVVLADSFFYEHFTCNEINNVMKHFYDNWDESIYFSYLEKFNLPKEKIIKDFSTGMLMKIKIITALSHKPNILILDEPTSGLDPIARAEILDIFTEFVEDKKNSVFVSSHITTDLEHIADYIVFISDGKILLNEKKDGLLKEYGIVECDVKTFNKYDKKDYIKYKKIKDTYQILINNKELFKKKYKCKNIENATLDDIMVLYIKGESI